MSKQEFLDRLTDPEAVTAREVAAEFLEYLETCNIDHRIWKIWPQTDILSIEISTDSESTRHDIDGVFIDYAHQYRIGHLCYIMDMGGACARYQIKKGKRRGE